MFVKTKPLFSRKGSVLIFSLIVLAFMLVSALSIATVSVTEKRASLSTEKSSRSFQVADSGVEIMLQKIYKGGFETSPLSALGPCANGEISGTPTTAGTYYTISFYDSSDTKLDCTEASWRNKVAKIRSEGVSGNTTRAVEVGVRPLLSQTYATWNPSDKGSEITLSNGNLTITQNGTGIVRSTISVATGKWYWEYSIASPSQMRAGVAKSGASLSNIFGSDAFGWSYRAADGTKFNNGSSGAYGDTYTVGDVMGVALDMDAGTLVFYKNNVSQGTAYTGLTGPMYAGAGNTTMVSTVNFGATPFTYSPPAGFNAGLYQ